MPPRQARDPRTPDHVATGRTRAPTCPYCADHLVVADGEAVCASGCPVVRCPHCQSDLAPFQNPDGSMPPGPHTCRHVVAVAPGREMLVVASLRDRAIAPLPTVVATGPRRLISDATFATILGDMAPLRAIYRTPYTRPATVDLIYGAIAHARLEATVTVVHPAAAEVGAVAFARQPDGPWVTIRQIDATFRTRFHGLQPR